MTFSMKVKVENAIAPYNKSYLSYELLLSSILLAFAYGVFNAYTPTGLCCYPLVGIFFLGAVYSIYYSTYYARFCRILLGFVVLLSYFAGSFVFNFKEEQYNSINTFYYEAEIVAKGSVVSRPVIAVYDNRTYYKFEVQLQALQSLKEGASGKWSRAEGVVRVFMPIEEGEVKENMGLTFSVRIKPFHYKALPGAIELKARYHSEALVGKVFDGKLLHKKGESSWFSTVKNSMRNACADRFQKYLSPQGAILVEGILFGADYTVLDKELTEQFSRTGLIHILSVSGSHIALLFAVLCGLGKRLGLKKKKIIPLALVVVLFYAWLAGFTYPVIRSVLIAFIASIAFISDRQYKGTQALHLTLLIILISSPYALFDISCQLSFAAAYGIVVFFPYLKERWGEKVSFIGLSIGLCASAMLFTLPFQSYYFQQLSLSMFVANLLITPLLEALLILGLMTVFLPLPALFLVMEIIIKWALLLTMTLGQIKYSMMTLKAYDAVESILYYFAIILFFFYLTRRLSLQRLISLGLVVVMSGLLYSHLSYKAFTRIHILSFPLEQTILFEGKDKKLLYVDFKNTKQGSRVKDEILKVMRFKGISKIDLLLTNKNTRVHYKEELKELKDRLQSSLVIIKNKEKIKTLQISPNGKLTIYGERDGSLSLAMSQEEKLFFLVNGQGGKKYLQLKKYNILWLADGLGQLSMIDFPNLKGRIYWKLPKGMMKNMELEEAFFTDKDYIPPISFY